jgi:predicted MFS family arabinose efflux permease
MAYNGMFGNLGLALGPLIAGLVNHYSGVESVYIVMGGLNFVGLVLLVQTKAAGTGSSTAKKKGGAASWPRFAILLVAMMLGGVVYRGTTVTLPALFELSGTGLHQFADRLLPWHIAANVLATGLVSLLYLIGMVGQYVGGKVGERFDLRVSYLVFHALTVPTALAMSWLTDLPLVLFAVVHSFFLLGMQPLENTLVARLTPPTMHSSAYGMKFVFTFGVGALAIKLVQVIEGQWSLAAVYPSLGIVSLLLVASIGILIRSTPPLRS